MARKKKDTALSDPKIKKTTARPSSSRKKTTQLPLVQRYTLAIRENFSKNRTLYTRYLLVLLVVVALGAFFFFKKDWFVAAVVNNQPITTVEYYQNLKAKDSKQVLNQIIRDKLITQEANKRGINISQADLDKKTSEIEAQLGGEEQLKQALESRSISETEFKNQIRVQLIVEKLLADQIKVSDKEVDEYVSKNKDNAGLGVDINNKEAVRKQLENEKLNEKFQGWYEELQKAAKIYTFI
jgi:hypothetical protein